MTRHEYNQSGYRRARAELLSRGYICPYCKVRRADTIDHVPPLSKFLPGEWAGSLVPCCRRCNSKRGGHRQQTRLQPTGSRAW